MRAEDDLRGALRSLERHAPDANALLLRMPRPPGRRLPPSRRHRTGRLRVITPVAAAASVIAVIAAALAITGGPHGHRPATESAATRAALASVPPYYVALTGFTGNLNERRQAVVRATDTGAVRATISPPGPYRTFSWLSGAADDRTFVIAAQRRQSGTGATRNGSELTKFFLLRFDPAARAARLTALPIPAEPAGLVAAIALSPDGSKLAVLRRARPSPAPAREIQVFSLATGSQRDWRWPGRGWIGALQPIGQPLSWAANGRTLAFQQWTGQVGNDVRVRLLDTDAPGGSLRSAKPAMTLRGPGSDVGNTLITPDGTKIVSARFPPGNGNQVKMNFTEFSAGTGRVVRVLDPWQFNVPPGPEPWQELIWTSSSGRTLIVIAPPGTDPARHWVRHTIEPVLGVLTGNHFTPIPGSPRARQNILEVAW
jgi:hypothetical protein